MKKKIYMPAVLFVASMVFSLFLCYNAGKNASNLPKIEKGEILNGQYYQKLESYIKTCVPWNEKIKQFAVSSEKKLGRYEFNDIYVGDNILIKKIEEPNSSYINKNIGAIENFVLNNNIPTYCAIIPSKAVIKQQKLPTFTPLTDQKKYIDKIYSRFAGIVSTIDVYQTLFAHNEEYIFYNTDEALTSLGNFYAYRQVASRLGKTPKSIDDFRMSYLSHDYYGETYENCEYKKIDPDIVTIFKLRSHLSDFNVTDNETGDTNFGLFDETAEPEDTILGGYKADITVDAMRIRERFNPVFDGYKSNLLIIGDKAGFNLIPFLALHYDEIRFVDISKLSPDDIFEIDINHYGQVAFIYSFDSFMSSEIPSMIKYT